MRQNKLVKYRSMQKKGDADTFDIAFSALQLGFIVVVVITMVILLAMMVIKDINIKPVETDVMAYRFLYSANGLNYKNDDTGRSYPGMIDIEKFNDDKIKDFFDFKDSDTMAAKLTLFNQNDQSEKVAYFNKEWFERYKPLAIINIPGSGSAQMSTKTLPVIITDQQMSYQNQGILRIEVVTPNE